MLLATSVGACAVPRTSGELATSGASGGGTTSESGGTSGGGGNGATGSGDESTSRGPDGTSDGSASSSGGGISFDVDPGSGDPTGDGGAGCRKVDFLFVVDSSPSMEEEQAALIASFDGFVSEIEQNIDAQQDFHVLVTTVSTLWDHCESLCSTGRLGPAQPGEQVRFEAGSLHETACPTFGCGFACDTDADCAGVGGTGQCGGGVCLDTFEYPHRCERFLGSGSTHRGATVASGTACEFTTGARFMDSSEGGDLATKFACAAEVGTRAGVRERPAESIIAAIDSSATDGCNDGFLRDDAILVVTFITDEPDVASAGGPQQWYDAIVDLKNGDASSAVMLGVFGDDTCGDVGTRLPAFVDLWGGQGLRGSICAPDYSGFFAQAVELVASTCDDFVPPG